MPRTKKKAERKIELRLVNSLNSLDLWNQHNDFMEELPSYITDNLKHTMRTYQKHALQNLDVVQRDKKADLLYNQLMFYMATGSGKTDIMAAIILYMYEQFDYQCFLFTVSTNAVVNKTRDNLVNSASMKYLFNDPIVINGNRITIKEVHSYPKELEPGVIYLRLSSIQTLSNEIYAPKENGITTDQIAKHKIIILADEAHHFNVGTRSKKQNQESKDWEGLLDLLRGLNPKNRQFEFTATIDLHNSEIYNKYQDKIVFQYDLSQFINQGFSKKVYKLQANNDDQAKMLNAVLLSQYRKRIARNMGIPDFKPVILFKSNKIAISNNTEQAFLDMINQLDAESLQDFIQTQNRSTESEALSIVYNYWLKQDMAETVSELKNDFNKLTEVNANDSGTKGIMENTDTFSKLNTLESPNNPIRVVFAVAKLSEGWDVLNLYDIVRISEQGKGTSIKDTNAEAQLIGRGARYNPFIYQGKKSYTRRFDDRKPEIQLLERLYYHTINDPKYLDHLRQSLDAIDLPVNDDQQFRTYTATVKPSFKRTGIYQHGNVYYNQLEKVPKEHYNSISRYGFDPLTTDPIDMVDTTIERRYDTGAETPSNALTTVQLVARFNNKADHALIRTGLSRNKFFRFNKISQYCPTLTSMKELITSDKWLGKAVIQARVANGTPPLSPQKKLVAVDRYLLRVQHAITHNFNREKGTSSFVGLPINEIVNDYNKRVSLSFNKLSQVIEPKDMKGQDWYVYDQAIVDKLEGSFIDQVASYMPILNKQYQDAYLIRIDERVNNFKLHDFGDDVINYDGYMPDFILYLKGDNYIYQVYVEPKGDQLLERDQWKQDLLERINPNNVTILGESDTVKLYGVKFYVNGDKRHMFEELKTKGLLKD
ncbi:DEAD/DEAH box helicase family protein [Limosilactobacillus reuteri]|uniref:DEAD/DEAH box helicase family protein n=1 Tax=Limosilactobacillus reuteri TaxID=1598 RepID=UPI000A2E6635|nr:DEAD/DEAH box helicase family protein [Limosilactobacillus reuteri]MCU4693018.1 DEAD/DEAH box helicase family protein [Limosilactobacillus reuteri]OTA43416.1 restriction endonuclease subunit R [Limosilactobacillus reuteri]OTA48195.1 restriction endonuclease subunit R [Limosilactobacillus reuteri]